MKFTVRALAVFLTVWLTAAASFPPCCWSMAYAHDHQAPQKASQSQVQPHEHHHHGSPESAAPATAATVMSAMPAQDCDTAQTEAVMTQAPSLARVDVRAATTAAVDHAMARASAAVVVLSDFTPPGGSPASAFLNPLRV